MDSHNKHIMVTIRLHNLVTGHLQIIGNGKLGVIREVRRGNNQKISLLNLLRISLTDSILATKINTNLDHSIMKVATDLLMKIHYPQTNHKLKTLDQVFKGS